MRKNSFNLKADRLYLNFFRLGTKLFSLYVPSAPGVQHLRPLPGGSLLRLAVPAAGLARPQEAVSRAQASAGPGVGARAMICPHPHLGEGSSGRNTGRGGVIRVRLAGRDGSGAQRDASVADSETTDGGQCRQRWLDQGVGRREEGQERAA